jgi:hypothetical protein
MTGMDRGIQTAKGGFWSSAGKRPGPEDYREELRRLQVFGFHTSTEYKKAVASGLSHRLFKFPRKNPIYNLNPLHEGVVHIPDLIFPGSETAA